MNTTYHTTTQLTEFSLFNPCQSISSYQVCRPPVFQDDRWRPWALGQLHWPAHWRDRQDHRPLAGWEWHQVSYEKCLFKKAWFFNQHQFLSESKAPHSIIFYPLVDHQVSHSVVLLGEGGVVYLMFRQTMTNPSSSKKWDLWCAWFWVSI